LEATLFEQGYKTILCNSANNKEKERAYINMLSANRVDGIIAGAHNLGIKEYDDIGLPIVSFDRFLSENIPIIGSDNFHGGYLATENLYLRGCRKIGILTGSLKSDSPTNDRLKGYEQFLASKQLASHIFTIDSRANSMALKTLEIKRILENGELDSLFCTDDLTAILVYNICQEMKISIPEDLKLIGYDGTKFVQNYFPQLSTIAQPISDFADLLVDLLIQRITLPEKKLEQYYALPIKLIQGKTT
jgi:LacI family sucrose operon transcriptional repressor